MSKPDLDKRLARLVSSSVCPAEDASKYAVELRQIADEVAPVETVHELSKVFMALADETRLRILKLLEFREMCVCEVMIALGLTQPTASHHLGILNNAGLIKKRKEGRWVYYSVTKPEIARCIFDSLSLHK